MGKINDKATETSFGIPKEAWNRLVEEFKAYRLRQEEYLQRFLGKFLILHDLGVAGAFETYDEAAAFGATAFAPETYLIQRCMPGNQEYAVELPSRSHL